MERKEVRVPLAEVDYYLKQGYVIGKPERTQEHKDNISKALTGLKNSEETKTRKSIAKLGKSWRVINGKRVWMSRELAREIDRDID